MSTVRRLAVGYYKANVAGWVALKRLVVHPDSGLPLAGALTILTVGLACNGDVGLAWVTAVVSVALYVVREIAA
ncbi:hypothetical protein ACWEHT_11535 [Streptomyces sp. NPDC004646]